MTDQSKELASSVQKAFQSGSALNICGNSTKSFLGSGKPQHTVLDSRTHSGIIEYEPAELVVVARGGTPLGEIDRVLSKHGQMLGFEPPFIGKGATLGGAVASGLSGPGRAYRGAVRDFILGAKFINGKGEVITSGGKVMKNVAGFDLFRPMAGSMGTLGVLLDMAIRVIPLPEFDKTLLHEESDEQRAIAKINRWATQMQTITAATWDGHNIRIRLSGSAASIKHGQTVIGGQLSGESEYWENLNDFNLDFFNQSGRLWRISLAPMSRAVHAGQAQLIDWGGAQRWIKSDEPAEEIRARAATLGGHAECYSEDMNIASFHPLQAGLMKIHRRFKASLDPEGILNPGRMYAEL